MLAWPDNNCDFVGSVLVRLDYNCVDHVALRIYFNETSQDPTLITRINAAYTEKFKVQAFDLIIEPDRQLLSLSIKTLVEDLLSSVTAEQMAILVEKGYCETAATVQKKKMRFGLGCCG